MNCYIRLGVHDAVAPAAAVATSLSPWPAPHPQESAVHQTSKY